MTATSAFPSEFAGAPPPRLLHQGTVRDAEEVLVLTYTCDLGFVEDVCVRPARTHGARVLTDVLDEDDNVVRRDDVVLREEAPPA